MTNEKSKLWYKHKVIIHNKCAWYNSLLENSHDSPYTFIHLCHACTNHQCVCTYVLNPRVSVCLRTYVCMNVLTFAYARMYVHACVWMCVGVRDDSVFTTGHTRVRMHESLCTSVHAQVCMHRWACTRVRARVGHITERTSIPFTW